MKSIKGVSSHWINENRFLDTKFAWQTGYAAFSVGESKILELQRYIANQKDHHKKNSFTEECQKLMEIYGFTWEDHGYVKKA